MKFTRYLSLLLPAGQSAFLWGARKTGKSTFLQEHFQNSIYVDLLQADIYQKYQREPHRLREELCLIQTPATVIVDEVQKIPLLLDEIHGLIEKQKNLQFILCGSSARKLKLMGANLLGGRAWRYMFFPLCYPEIGVLDWKRIFTHGLIPSHYLSEQPQKHLAAYIYDYILPEVHMEVNLRKREPFARFLDALGHCNGEMINYTNIARDCGVDRKTVMTYFDTMEDMYLGYFLRPFRKKSTRQIIQEMPKFYLFDTGVANYLKRYEFEEIRGEAAGRSFEHYIFLEFTAYKWMKEKRDELTYWRTKDGYEVDFVFQEQAFEVKISSSIQKKDIKGLLCFGKEYGGKLHVICLEKKKRVIKEEGQEITIWPVQDFLTHLWSDGF